MGLKPAEFDQLTLHEIGQYCEAVQQDQQEKICQQIQILAALAKDINSFYATCTDMKNHAKYHPMRKELPFAFQREDTPKITGDPKKSEQHNWIQFLFG